MKKGFELPPDTPKVGYAELVEKAKKAKAKQPKAKNPKKKK